jgi:hypothetical protein
MNGYSTSKNPSATSKREDFDEDERVPAAGPHAKPSLTNPDATPGTGVLPPVEGDDPNVQPTG